METTANSETEQVPANFKAILDWCEVNRPDLYPVVMAEKNNDGFILLMTVGFESGRLFQKHNPDYPFDQGYASVDLKKTVEPPPISNELPAQKSPEPAG